MKKYVFKPYSPLFPELFEKEKARISGRIGISAVIEHVGSTAVPDLGGKGIIDIAIAVNKEDMQAITKDLQSLGYEYRPAFSTKERFYFVIYLPDPEEGQRRYHIHLTFLESSEWKELIGFRDYLRHHPEEANEYAEIKKRAVIEADQEGERYRKLKEPMFQKVKSIIHPPVLHEQHMGRGVAFGILAAVCYTMMSLFGKVIGDGTSTDTILFARFAISLILILPWVIKNPNEVLKASTPLTIVTRSLFTLIAFVCFFYALKFIPLSDALLLNNTSPLFVPIVAWIVQKHRTSYKVWMGILLGFIGVAIVLRPAPGFFQAAAIIALTSGIFSAIAIVIIRRLTKTTPVIQILFYNFFICTLLTGIALPFGWRSFNREMLLLLVGVGLFGAAYQFFSTLSYAKTPVRITSPLMFLCIVFGVFADWLIWNKIPDVWALIGMLCVIVGGIITIYFGQKEIMRK